MPASLSEKAWSRVVCMVSDADGGEGPIKQLEDQYLSYYMPTETIEKTGTPS